MSEVKYYLIARRSRLVRSVDSILSLLDPETDEWIQNNRLFTTITFEASTKDITEKKAKDWVAENHAALSVEWV